MYVRPGFYPKNLIFQRARFVGFYGEGHSYLGNSLIVTVLRSIQYLGMIKVVPSYRFLNAVVDGPSSSVIQAPEQELAPPLSA